MRKKQYSGHPDARRPKGHILTWINMALLCIIVLCCNYIGCHEYGRKDLSEEHRYSISEQSKALLGSGLVQKHETPIRIIFAFRRSTPNYSGMYALLEEFKEYGKGKIEIECFDPILQPNRARAITDQYGVEFNQNLCVVDARKDTSAKLGTFDDFNNERAHVRFLPGHTFVKYEELPDGRRVAASLEMDAILSAGINGAIEGQKRLMFVLEGKGGVSRDDQGLLATLSEIARALNITFEIGTIDQLDEYLGEESKAQAGKQQLRQIEGLLILGPTIDFTQDEIDVLNNFWNRDGCRNSIYVALDPMCTDMPYLFRFLSGLGVRPNGDRVLLRDRKRAYDNISAVFPKSLNCTRSFWNGTTQVSQPSMSFTLENWNDNSAAVLNTYPLLVTTPDYYGETRGDRDPTFDPNEDFEGPLCLQAAVTRGSQDDPDNFSTLIVQGNTSILQKDGANAEMRDYMRTTWAWMIHRSEYTGKSAKAELHPKIELNRHSKHALEMLTLLIMPLLALLVALCLWNIRRH